MYLDPRPTEETIGEAYRRYYTHTASAIARGGTVRVSLQRARNAYLNRHLGHKLSPAAPALGALVALVPRARRQSERAIRHLPPPFGGGRLLDVGCGNGAFLATAERLGWSARGIEPDAEAVASARARGLDAVHGTVTEFIQNGHADAFDVITLCHTAEHLHQPRQHLEACRDLLRPGGILWIATPNAASIGHSRFQRHWRGLEPPRHLIIFSPKALCGLLVSLGLIEVQIRRTQPVQRRMYRESAEIMRASGSADRAPANLSARAEFDELVAGRRPARGDELVVTARKAI